MNKVVKPRRDSSSCFLSRSDRCKHLRRRRRSFYLLSFSAKVTENETGYPLSSQKAETRTSSYKKQPKNFLEVTSIILNSTPCNFELKTQIFFFDKVHGYSKDIRQEGCEQVLVERLQ